MVSQAVQGRHCEVSRVGTGLPHCDEATMYCPGSQSPGTRQARQVPAVAPEQPWMYCPALHSEPQVSHAEKSSAPAPSQRSRIQRSAVSKQLLVRHAEHVPLEVPARHPDTIWSVRQLRQAPQLETSVVGELARRHRV